MSFRQRNAKPYNYDYARMWAQAFRRRRLEGGVVLLPPKKEEKDELKPVVREIKEKKPEKIYKGNRVGLINTGVGMTVMLGFGSILGFSINVAGAVLLMASALMVAGLTYIGATLMTKDYGEE